MKKVAHFFACISVVMLVGLILSDTVKAQDATKVDPDHYKVEFENEFVRIIRITYGPGEKSKMHEHPDAVGVTLKGGITKMNLPDGKTVENESKAGEAFWAPASKHLPENIDTKPTELILVELKHKKK